MRNHWRPIRCFFNEKTVQHIKMGEGDGVAKYMNEFNTISCQFFLVCINFANEVRTLVLLSSFLES